MSMRNLRFRAWDKERSKMIYSFGDRLNSKNYVLFWSTDNNCLFCGNYQDKGDWNEPTLMQSTGLFDKNGKEIYEGDILEFDPKEWIGSLNNKWAVEWDNDGGCWDTGGGTTRECKIFKSVIGNIYENPELLSTPSQQRENV